MILSALVITVYLIIAVSSIQSDYYFGKSSQKIEYEGDGIYNEEIVHPHFENDPFRKKTITRGKRDEYGNWDGIVQISNYEGLIPRSFESVQFVNGYRNGKSTTEFQDGSAPIVVCYFMGKVVPCDDNGIWCSDNSRQDKTSFQILEEKYPWFIVQYLSESETYKDSFKRWMIAVEDILNTYSLSEQNFQELYDETWTSDDIKENFKNINSDYQVLRLFSSRDVLKNNQFRRSLIDRYTISQLSTYDILTKKYVHFKEKIELYCNAFGVPVSELKEFCDDFDTRLDAKITIPNSDPLFIDSLDWWSYQVFNEISGEGYKDNDNGNGSNLLNKMSSDYQKYKLFIRNQSEVLSNVNNNNILGNSLSDTIKVAAIIQSIILMELLEVDAIKISIKEACFTNQSISRLPEMVTNILDQNAESVKVKGIILHDGQDSIILSGIAWDTIYNPDLNSNYVVNQSGAYEYDLTISGLLPFKRYFIRSFAVNSVGVSFGNTLEIKTQEVNNSVELNAFNINFNLYPNPVDDKFNMTFDELIPLIDVHIYSLNGNCIFKRHYTSTKVVSVNASDFPSGIYTILLLGPGFQQSKQLIVHH